MGRNQGIENSQRNREISKIYLAKSRRLNEKRQNEFEKTKSISKKRSFKFKKKRILEDERLSKGYMVNWPIRREKSRRSSIKNIIYFLTCNILTRRAFY